MIDASGELIIKLISNKEESTVIESFSKLFGTISKKNGKKLRPSLPGQNPESREDGADSKIKGQIRLEMAHLTMNPCKIQEMALSIGYKKRPLCLVSLKCIYVPAYGKRGVRFPPKRLLVPYAHYNAGCGSAPIFP